MRNFIIILSILFFALSGLIKVKEASLSSAAPLNNPTGAIVQGLSSEVEQALVKISKEQSANQAMVKDLQAMVAGLEKRLAMEMEKKKESTAPPRGESKARVMAVLGGGMFNSGQVVASEELMKTVHDIVPDILSYPGYDLVIEGHTDNIPIKLVSGKGYSDNMELSFLRAKAVARVLAENGVPSDRITVVSYGKTRPIASNDTPEGRARNRRVEIKLLPGKGY